MKEKRKIIPYIGHCYDLNMNQTRNFRITITILVFVAITTIGGVTSILSPALQDAKADCVDHHNGVATTCYFPGKNEHCTSVFTPSEHFASHCHIGK